VLLVALGLVYWLGAEQILQRFSAMQSLEATAGKRASMRRDTYHILLDHPVLGTGLGTLQIVFPRYETNYDGKVVNHAHNDYLEALAETGLLGGFCCAWFLFELFKGYFRRSRDSASPPFVAALNFAGLLASVGFLIHALVDFNLHIPANAVFFLLMANLAGANMEAGPAASTSPRKRRQLVHTGNP
jgi:O-antigen ligase